MVLVSAWTGRTACALQAALRLSNEAFAEHLGISVRTVAGWHQKPTIRPKTEIQQLLDTAHERAPAAVRERFAKLVSTPTDGEISTRADVGYDMRVVDAELRLSADPNISAALDWLDRQASWEPGSARRAVASRLASLDIRELQDRGNRRGRVGQRRIAHALGEYYTGRIGSYGRYLARYGRDTEAETSILTNRDWLDLDCPLTASCDRLAFAGSATASSPATLDDYAAGHAAARLAETLTLGIRMVNIPLYRLLSIDIRKGMVAGSVGLAPFVEYALTMDLLEGELIDALVDSPHLQPSSVPLRGRYLPDLTSVLDVAGRLCAGGVLALCAIARPASPHRGGADYLLLVQERSGQVVNAARRLAVIPKGFHEPLADVRFDAPVGATLRRELEEELFGREDLDNTLSDQRRADPMHPSLWSAPMRWLMADTDRLKTECTGFGLNLVSGNFEFASLIVIDDEDFWHHYGGQVQANWEATGLRQYSSLDHELLAELVRDEAWTNEGLFALLQGLRRLRQIGGSRVRLPAIEWEIL